MKIFTMNTPLPVNLPLNFGTHRLTIFHSYLPNTGIISMLKYTTMQKGHCSGKVT